MTPSWGCILLWMVGQQDRHGLEDLSSDRWQLCRQPLTSVGCTGMLGLWTAAFGPSFVLADSLKRISCFAVTSVALRRPINRQDRELAGRERVAWREEGCPEERWPSDILEPRALAPGMSRRFSLDKTRKLPDGGVENTEVGQSQYWHIKK